MAWLSLLQAGAVAFAALPQVIAQAPSYVSESVYPSRALNSVLGSIYTNDISKYDWSGRLGDGLGTGSSIHRPANA